MTIIIQENDDVITDELDVFVFDTVKWLVDRYFQGEKSPFFYIGITHDLKKSVEEHEKECSDLDDPWDHMFVLYKTPVWMNEGYSLRDLERELVTTYERENYSICSDEGGDGDEHIIASGGPYMFYVLLGPV